MSLFKEDMRFSEKIMPTVKKFIAYNAARIVKINDATAEEDMEFASDLVIYGAKIAVRTRKDNVKFRDLTIRASRPYGTKTELEKIKQGYSDFIFYAWTKGLSITEYVIVDSEILRQSGLLNKVLPSMKNADGTTFVFLALPDIKKCGALVHHGQKEGTR